MKNYYSENENYIHLKFGDARKKYNFTSEFIKQNKKFCEEYIKYFNEEVSKFENVFQIVFFAKNNEIPVDLFYYNYTDTPAEDYDEIIEYLLKENNIMNI